MDIFWTVYLTGCILALVYLTEELIDYCIKNRLNYSEVLSDYKTIGIIALYSLGSWLTLLVFCCANHEND
jgi:hypothetical protein